MLPEGSAFEERAGRALGHGLLASAALVAVYVHATCAVLPYDDAFITYRYVESLVQGRGLVYNVGEHVFGSTSPLHVFFVAACKALLGSVPTPVLAVRLNLIAYVLAAWGSYLALRRFTSSHVWAAAGTAALFADPWLLAWSTGGMETFLFAGCALFAILAFLDRRPIAAGVWTALAILTRPEGVLLFAGGAIAFHRSAGALARFAGATAACVAPWAIFAVLSFGSVVPLSVVAKNKPLYPLPAGYALQMIAMFLEKWVAGVEFRPPHALRTTVTLAPFVLAPIVAAGAATLRVRGAWTLGAAFVALVVLYAIGNPLIQEWYVPPLAVLGSAAVWVVVPVGVRAAARTARRSAVARFVLGAIVAATLGATAARWATSGGPTVIVQEDPARRRIEAYEAAARLLNAISTPASTLAGPEIGSLGFWFHGRVLDACGLVSPEAHPFLPVPPEERESFASGAISTAFVEATRPDYVVSMTNFARYSVARSEWFREHYDPIERVALPLPCWGAREVLVFRRKGVVGGD